MNYLKSDKNFCSRVNEQIKFNAAGDRLIFCLQVVKTLFRMNKRVETARYQI